MTVEEIQSASVDLEIQLHRAAATMQLDDNIYKIRERLLRLQEECPHQKNGHNYELEERCPYCGKRFGRK